jgi:hypothetical protein
MLWLLTVLQQRQVFPAGSSRCAANGRAAGRDGWCWGCSCRADDQDVGTRSPASVVVSGSSTTLVGADVTARLEGCGAWHGMAWLVIRRVL